MTRLLIQRGADVQIRVEREARADLIDATGKSAQTLAAMPGNDRVLA